MTQQLAFNDLLKHLAINADFGVFNIPRENLDITKMASIISTHDTAQYYIDHALKALPMATPREVLGHGLNEATLDGLILEFGVGSGGALRFIDEHVKDQKIYGFDSFDGLPEDWRGRWKKGAFKQDSLPGGFSENVELVRGLFADTLPQFMKKHGKTIRFIHMDCDLYSSTKTVFDCLGEYIEPGTVIIFDEYWNYAGWRAHEHLALQEFVERSGKKYEYTAFATSGLQVAIQFV